MEAISDFSLLEIPKAKAHEGYRRRLVFRGNATGTVINGDELSRQYRVGDSYLVISCYDYFEAASYWFYLIDRSARICDVASTPDYFGFIERIEHPSAATMTFGFFDTQDRWSLSVVENDRRASSLSTLIRRLRGRAPCTSRLLLKKMSPETA